MNAILIGRIESTKIKHGFLPDIKESDFYLSPASFLDLESSLLVRPVFENITKPLRFQKASKSSELKLKSHALKRFNMVLHMNPLLKDAAFSNMKWQNAIYIVMKLVARLPHM